jgi:hypothetical protein
VPRGVLAVREGKPLKGEPHERRRCETKPAGLRGEQGVRRLRKPVGAAQPGQASPVLVAPRYLIRCRGEEPQESVSAATCRFGGMPGQAVRLGSNSGAARSPGEESA